MDANLIVFFVLGAVAVLTAIGMLLNKNAVYSALFLILNFGTVAVFYLVLGAPFIAMTQITVYAGAIMVLFLFVIMLLGAEELKKSTRISWQAPSAIILTLILAGEAMFVIFAGDVSLSELAVQVESGFASPSAIGAELFTNYFLPFQITAVLLLAAMVGAIVIAQRNKRKKGQE
jgi:NADH-quinone oxidoreductase subunit J